MKEILQALERLLASANHDEYLQSLNKEQALKFLDNNKNDYYLVKEALQKSCKFKQQVYSIIDDVIELINMVDTDLPLSNFECAIRMDTLPDICVGIILDKLNEIKKEILESK